MQSAIALALELHCVLFITLCGGSTPTISTPQIFPAIVSSTGSQSPGVTKGPRQVQEFLGQRCGWDQNGDPVSCDFEEDTCMTSKEYLGCVPYTGDSDTVTVPTACRHRDGVGSRDPSRTFDLQELDCDGNYGICITYIMWPYMADQSQYKPAYTYFTCGTPGMQQVQRLFSESPDHDNPTNNGGAVNDPNLIGGVVGGLSALGLLLLGFLFLRRKRRETTNNPDEQAVGPDGQRADSAAIELPPDTTKSELQCPSDPSVARDRGFIQSRRTALEVQGAQRSHVSPVRANSNMIPPSELAARNEVAGHEAEHSNIAFKTHESGERSSTTDRITI